MFLRRPSKPAPKGLSKVEKPVEERKPIFSKPLSRFEQVIEWAPQLNRNPRIQRLGFKAEGGLEEAFASALEFTRMCNSVYARTTREHKLVFCRLIAVYEEKAFQDYAEEPLYKREAEKKALKKHVDSVNQSELTTKTPKRVRVR